MCNTPNRPPGPVDGWQCPKCKERSSWPEEPRELHIGLVFRCGHCGALSKIEPRPMVSTWPSEYREEHIEPVLLALGAKTIEAALARISEMRSRLESVGPSGFRCPACKQVSRWRQAPDVIGNDGRNIELCEHCQTGVSLAAEDRGVKNVRWKAREELGILLDAMGLDPPFDDLDAVEEAVQACLQKIHEWQANEGREAT